MDKFLELSFVETRVPKYLLIVKSAVNNIAEQAEEVYSLIDGRMGTLSGKDFIFHPFGSQAMVVSAENKKVTQRWNRMLNAALIAADRNSKEISEAHSEHLEETSNTSSISNLQIKTQYDQMSDHLNGIVASQAAEEGANSAPSSSQDTIPVHLSAQENLAPCDPPQDSDAVFLGGFVTSTTSNSEEPVRDVEPTRDSSALAPIGDALPAPIRAVPAADAAVLPEKEMDGGDRMKTERKRKLLIQCTVTRVDSDMSWLYFVVVWLPSTVALIITLGTTAILKAIFRLSFLFAMEVVYVIGDYVTWPEGGLVRLTACLIAVQSVVIRATQEFIFLLRPFTHTIAQVYINACSALDSVEEAAQSVYEKLANH